MVSFWAKGATNPSLNGTEVTPYDATAAPGSWRYYEKIVGSVTSVSITGTASIYIDELRLYPSAAQMTTYAYDVKEGLISSTDVNNTTTYYEYTNRRQLEFIRDFEYNILKKNEYRYVRD